MQEGKAFTVLQGYDRATNVTTLRVHGARFHIAFGGLDYNDRHTQGEHVGLAVSCPRDGLAFRAGLPDVICGESLTVTGWPSFRAGLPDVICGESLTVTGWPSGLAFLTSSAVSKGLSL